MPVSPARDAAYRILRRVESGRDFAVDLLQAAQVSKLQEVDRRLATELVMGILRWRGELDFWIRQLSGKPLEYFDPEVATILRLGIYQIRFLEKIPKSAVVNEAVELSKAARKRSAAGLVNAVLRKCERPLRRPGSKGFGQVGAEWAQAARRSIPAWLLERWADEFGPEGAKSLAWASVMVPRTTLRVTASGSKREEVQRQLAEEAVQTRPGRFGPQALGVESGSVQPSKAAREGRVVIQDEASQLVGALVAPRAGQCVLDLCAAPGIKTGQLVAALDQGTLVACDLSARRLRTLRNLLPTRVPSGVRLHLVRLDATRKLPFGREFDRILLDAPCSGTGTLARNPEIKWRLQAQDIVRLAEVQRKMLRNALAVLAPGGRLVYATCSLESEENEQVVESILQESPQLQLLGWTELAAEFPAFSELFDRRGYFRTRPDVHSMDGFFAAVVVRKRQSLCRIAA